MTRFAHSPIASPFGISRTACARQLTEAKTYQLETLLAYFDFLPVRGRTAREKACAVSARNPSLRVAVDSADTRDCTFEIFTQSIEPKLVKIVVGP